jgi:CspA family cold shock protein
LNYHSYVFIDYLCPLLIIFIITMRTGTVKFFNESKGYGFITDEETGKDIFVHATGIKAEELREGDRVSYEEEEGRKGKVAAQVAVIE